MKRRRRTKLVHQGRYLAEVDVDLLIDDAAWAPYLSVEDAYRLDDVREALKRGDVAAAREQGRVFTLTPVAV